MGAPRRFRWGVAPVNIEAAFDLIALGVYVAALIIGLVIWFRGGSTLDGLSTGLMLGAMLLLAFVALSNSLQYLGVTASLDALEDYAEVLVFPLIAYATYVMHSVQQVSDMRMTTRVARAEHDLMLSIIDATPVALVVVDEQGHVTFANDLARSVLRIEETEGAVVLAGRAQVVPSGTRYDGDSQAVFHPSALRRGLTGEVFDVVTPSDASLSIRLSSSSFGGDDPQQHGAVIVFQAASAGSRL